MSEWGVRVYFKPLEFSDLPTMHLWFNKMHVIKWYSKKKWSFQDIEAKYTPYILNKNGIEGFLIFFEDIPIGYIQYFPAESFYQLNTYKYPKIKKSAGLDMFIGEEAFLGRGLSKTILREFLDTVISKKYLYCITDPEIENIIARKTYSSAGFKRLDEIYSEDGEVHSLYMSGLLTKSMNQIRQSAKEDHPSDKGQLVLQNI